MSQRPPLLSEQQRNDWLAAHSAWRYEDSYLLRSLTFASFREAFAFMTRAAIVAERLDHHPNWSNVYNLVDIAVTTHDVGGVTTLDLQFAEAVDQILTATS